MAKFPRSIKANIPANATLAQKALISLSAVNVAAPAQGDGNAGLPCQTFVALDMLLIESGGGTFDAMVHWCYADADFAWVEDLVVGPVACAANSTARSILAPSGASRVAVQILNIAGGARASAFIIGRSRDKEQ